MIPNVLYGKQHCQCKIYRVLLNGVSGVKTSERLTPWQTWRLSPLPFVIIQTPHFYKHCGCMQLDVAIASSAIAVTPLPAHYTLSHACRCRIIICIGPYVPTSQPTNQPTNLPTYVCTYLTACVSA